MSSKKRTVLNNVKIFDIANKGQAIAKFNERVILVDKGVPGDICDILVTKNDPVPISVSIAIMNSHTPKNIEANIPYFVNIPKVENIVP